MIIGGHARIEEHPTHHVIWYEGGFTFIAKEKLKVELWYEGSDGMGAVGPGKYMLNRLVFDRGHGWTYPYPMGSRSENFSFVVEVIPPPPPPPPPPKWTTGMLVARLKELDPSGELPVRMDLDDLDVYRNEELVLTALIEKVLREDIFNEPDWAPKTVVIHLREDDE